MRRSTRAQRDLSLLITRMLDDLYWVMSYSRWKDERYWPAFRAALMREHPQPHRRRLAKAREFNFQRYHFQGIGRYAPDAAYARGLADLAVLADLVPANGYVHGASPTSVDAGIYGFIANIYFFDIDTPLKQFVLVAAKPRAPLHRDPRSGDQPAARVARMERLRNPGPALTTNPHYASLHAGYEGAGVSLDPRRPSPGAIRV